MTKNKLKDYGTNVLEEIIGYQPISSSIKPVHIANGLFRYILGESFDIKTLNDWSKRFKDGREIMTASQIRERYSAIIDDNFSDDDINSLRDFIEKIFNADNAVTPNVKFSTLTIASKTQVTGKVQNEYGIPLFLFKILNSKIGKEISPCINLVRKYLNNEEDELSRIAKPIVYFNCHSTKKDESVFTDEQELTGIEFRIRKAFDRLSENEINLFAQNKLLSLERIVLFSCLSIILHLSSRVIDLSPSYNENDRIPILFDADGNNESIKFASQESFISARLGIEEFFEKALEEMLIKEGYHQFTHDQILKRINEIPLQDTSRKANKETEDKNRDNYIKMYLGFYGQCKEPFQAIVKATRFLLFTNVYSSTNPSEFITSFGGRIGLLAPRGSGGRKRYSPDPLILEVILLSILENNRQLNLSEFGLELWKQFGILIGANPEHDYEVLTRWNISQNTPGDLAGGLTINAEKISDIYISMGYGKRYADGVTVLSLRGGI